MGPGPEYSEQPVDREAFTRSFDRAYSRLARVYDLGVKAMPVWRAWLRHALEHLEGPRVLEVSFGTGWLLTQYSDEFEAHGIELNEKMTTIARRNLERAGRQARLQRASVEALPYPDGSFDTVLSTMAFTGYPDADTAMSELRRVLRPRGRLVIIDVDYPTNGNRLGTTLVRLWKRTGDLIRDMSRLLREFGFDVSDQEIGGWGSIHCYVAVKTSGPTLHQ